MNETNDFLQIGIDYGGEDEDKHCAILNLYYNDTNHLIYETFDKEQIKALDNVLQNILKQQLKARALDIMVKKKVDVSLVYASSIFVDYNDEIIRIYGKRFGKYRILTEEEFDTLTKAIV